MRGMRYARKIKNSIVWKISWKAMQHFIEDDIQRMHFHYGYSEFSALLRSFIPTDALVLDLGCNKGFETLIISKTNKVVAIDLFEDFVNVAKQRGVDARVMDFHKMTFNDEFDCVYSNNSMEHARYPAHVIDGIFRALRRDGILIIGMPTDGNNLESNDPAHYFKATKEDVLSLLKNKFEILRVEEIDAKEHWNWEIPPSNNKMLLIVARVMK